jgi:type 1 glutamine amidotransferase
MSSDKFYKNISRRNILKTGAAAIAGASASANLLAAPKKPGEVRVVILAGDYWHNSMMYERHWRRILGVTGWRLMFAQSANFITPEVIDNTDLLMFSRYGGGNLEFTTAGLVEERPGSEVWMTPEQEDSIMDNVVKRGMGLLPFHCSIANESNKKVLNLFGVDKMIMHGPLVMSGFYDMNQDHAITKGVEDFEEVDEIFGAEMLDVNYTPLFRARQNYDLIRKASGDTQEQFYGTRENFPLDRMAGWCREEGNGRIVYLNCMSSHTVFWKKSMKEIMWRSAHWAMHKDIPESGLIEGRSQDRE